MNSKLKSIKQYNEKDLRSMLNDAPYLMWIKDNKGRYRFVNNEFLDFFKLEKKDVIGVCDEDVFFNTKNNIKVKEEDLYKKVFETQENKVVVGNVTRWMESYTWPLYESGEKKDWIAGIATDITEDKLIDNSICDTTENIISDENFAKLIESLAVQAEAAGACIFIYDIDKKSAKLDVSCGCCSNIPKEYSVQMSDEECKDSIDNGIFRRFDTDDNDVWVYNLKRFFDDSFGIKVFNLNDNRNIIGFIIFFYKKKSDKFIFKNEFIKRRCRKIAYLYMKKVILNNLNIEFTKRKVSENYMKLLLETATDFYGILDVDKEHRSFKVKDIYNIGLKDKGIVNTIESLEYKGNAGKIVSDINGYRIRSDMRCIKGEGKEERFIEFRWHRVGNGQVIITGKDKTIEKQLSDYNKELEEYIELENMKSEFFANLSHEFKTPINVIITASQLIKRTDIDGNIKYDTEYFEKYISVVKQNSYRLSRLINNLIDTRRIDSGYYHLDMGNYNIVKIIEDVVMSMKDYIYNKEREFIFESNCDEIKLSCDPEKIERIMMNLISNAVKYTNRFDTIRVTIEKDKEEKNALITVENNGVKLDYDSAKIIFNRFVRADNVLSRRCEGSGIGLYIVKSLVELHKGKIWVDVSEKGKTKFIFSIPIVKAEENNDSAVNRKSSNKRERCSMEFSDIY